MDDIIHKDEQAGVQALQQFTRLHGTAQLHQYVYGTASAKPASASRLVKPIAAIHGRVCVHTVSDPRGATDTSDRDDDEWANRNATGRAGRLPCGSIDTSIGRQGKPREPRRAMVARRRHTGRGWGVCGDSAGRVRAQADG